MVDASCGADEYATMPPDGPTTKMPEPWSIGVAALGQAHLRDTARRTPRPPPRRRRACRSRPGTPGRRSARKRPGCAGSSRSGSTVTSRTRGRSAGGRSASCLRGLRERRERRGADVRAAREAEEHDRPAALEEIRAERTAVLVHEREGGQRPGRRAAAVARSVCGNAARDGTSARAISSPPANATIARMTILKERAAMVDRGSGVRSGGTAIIPQRPAPHGDAAAVRSRRRRSRRR